MVVNRSGNITISFTLNPLNFEQVEIDAFYKAVFHHQRKPILVGGCDFKKFVEFPSADDRASGGVCADFDKFGCHSDKVVKVSLSRPCVLSAIDP